MKANSGSEELASEAQLLRIRVAAAEMELKDIREQAREAKRRQKEAKRIARRARKHFKRSKKELAELRQTLAKVELKLHRAGGSVPVTRVEGKPTNGRIGSIRISAGGVPVGVTRKRQAVRKSAVLSHGAIDAGSPGLESQTL